MWLPVPGIKAATELFLILRNTQWYNLHWKYISDSASGYYRVSYFIFSYFGLSTLEEWAAFIFNFAALFCAFLFCKVKFMKAYKSSLQKNL